MSASSPSSQANLSRLRAPTPEGRLSQADLEAELAKATQQIEQKSSNEQSPLLQGLLQSRRLLAQKVREPITFSAPILHVGDTPLIFPCTINVIQGQTGVHKSRLAETICSVVLGATTDQLGFRLNPTFQPLLCYVDTERNLKEQLPYAMQSIKRKTGIAIDQDLPRLDFITLLEVPREQRFDALKVYLDYLRQRTEQHIFLVLDVLTDCVSDFNRADASLALIDLMNQAINRFDVTFLCVIHENPGTTAKARGHLGTEVCNKASTVIQVRKIGRSSRPLSGTI